MLWRSQKVAVWKKIILSNTWQGLLDDDDTLTDDDDTMTDDDDTLTGLTR